MANFSSNRLVNRDPGSFQTVEAGYVQLTKTPDKPPGPFLRLGESGAIEAYFVDGENGSVVAVETNTNTSNRYVQLYVYVDNPYNSLDNPTEFNAWDYWKKLDLNWPKIDPRTGEPFSQYLEWWSPLAE